MIREEEEGEIRPVKPRATNRNTINPRELRDITSQLETLGLSSSSETKRKREAVTLYSPCANGMTVVPEKRKKMRPISISLVDTDSSESYVLSTIVMNETNYYRKSETPNTPIQREDRLERLLDIAEDSISFKIRCAVLTNELAKNEEIASLKSQLDALQNAYDKQTNKLNRMKKKNRRLEKKLNEPCVASEPRVTTEPQQHEPIPLSSCHFASSYAFAEHRNTGEMNPGWYMSQSEGDYGYSSSSMSTRTSPIDNPSEEEDVYSLFINNEQSLL